MRADEIDLAHDRGLVEAWQAGDESAFEELYRRYFDRLRQFCQRRVGDRAVAEELAQETFVRAYKALPRFEGERRFYPWMTVIAGRLCIDHHRRNSRVQPHDDVDPGFVDDGHEERLTLQVDLEHLDRAFRRLGARHAEVLDLRERQGMSYHAIAAELDVPHSTVEALLFRARKALRREFQLVSAERLVALPGIGWAVSRALRLRDRVAASGTDLGALTSPLAAGAVSAVLAVLPVVGPAGATAPTVATVATRPAAAVATPSPELEVPPPALDAPAAGTTPAAPAATPPGAPRVAVVSDADAERRSDAMPLHLELPQSGAGVDPGPVVRQVNVVTRSLP